MRMLSLSLTLAVVLAVTANSTVIYVPNDQPTVQAGIDAASAGDTVQIAPGRYYENVALNKTITLLGEARNTTVIDASDSGDCILVTAAGAVISNLSVQHGGMMDTPDDPWPSGIKIIGAHRVLIEDCYVHENGQAGISLTESFFCIIRSCYISENEIGICFYENPLGDYVNNASNQITGNAIITNSYRGICFDHGYDNRDSANIVRSNLIAGNGTGMHMVTSEYNEVTYNYFYLNYEMGLVLEMCLDSGEYNSIHHNSFYRNNAPDVQAMDVGGGEDYWYDTVTQEGNYWSDYEGIDGDDDGIGDTPYAIEYDESFDLYPLMFPEDSDGDGFIDSVDNCPGLFNLMSDYDHDLIGNACDDCTDFDGDGYGNAGMVANICPDDNCSSIYNPNQEDADGDGIGDSCDYRPQSLDLLWTDCLGLKVDDNGNFGVKGNSGDGGCNMDYMNYGGECDPNADTYLYDGSPFVLRINDDDTLLSQAMHNTHTYRRVGWGRPYDGIISTQFFDTYRSGSFVTQDFTIGMEQWFWSPKNQDYCPFIIKALRVYSFDGEQHDNVSIGTVIDWDIPTDGGNVGGYDSSHRLIYTQGLEDDGQGCQSNDSRFGGEALLSFYMNDTCASAFGSQPFSAYAAANADHLWPEGGLAASTLDSMIHLPGYTINHDSTDLHTVMTYLVDQTIMPGDTLTIYSVLTTVRDGSLSELLNNVSLAQHWFSEFVVRDCYCCKGLRGNVDNDPQDQLDISDLVALVDYMFTGGPPPTCLEEADLNADGSWDIADLVYMVDFMFNGGSPPVACP